MLDSGSLLPSALSSQCFSNFIIFLSLFLLFSSPAFHTLQQDSTKESLSSVAFPLRCSRIQSER